MLDALDAPPTVADTPRIRAAIIGLGNQGREHLAAITQANSPLELCGICDPRLGGEAFLADLPSPLPETCFYNTVEEFLSDLPARILEATKSLTLSQVFMRQ